MYQLFKRLPNTSNACGLQPISQIVREHIVDVRFVLISGRCNLALLHTYSLPYCLGLKKMFAHLLINVHSSMQVGMSLVRKQEGEKDHANYTQQLIDLHDQYLALVHGPFENNQLFQKVLKEAFEVFVNKDIGNTTTAELLSTFCDNIMKTGGDKLEGEIDSNLDKIVMLFSYLSDKDMFAEFYRKQLAKRLLLNRSASDDDERSLITKLKVTSRKIDYDPFALCIECDA